jgi:hypothetical protein
MPKMALDPAEGPEEVVGIGSHGVYLLHFAAPKKVCNVSNRTDFQAYIGDAHVRHCDDESKGQGTNDEVPAYLVFITWVSGLLRRRSVCKR